MQFFNTRNLTKAVCLITYSLISLVSVTYADDTEIFKVNPSGNSGNANILIMLDTSSSMNQGIKYANGYTPDFEIPSSYNDCEEDVVYVDTKGNPGVPSCNNTDTIQVSAFRCRAVAEFLIEVGSVGTRANQFKTAKNGKGDSEEWSLFPNGTDDTDPVECLDDLGFHGDVSVLTVINGQVAVDEAAMTTETTNNFTANGDADNPWANTEDTSIAWTTDNFVTFYTGHFLNYVDYVKSEGDPDDYVETNGIELAKTAMTNIISDFRGFNLGIGRYDQKGNQKTAFILAPTVSLDDANLRADLQRFYIDPLGEKIGELLDNGDITTEDNTFSSGQPLSSGQYEAYLYFKGEPPLGGGAHSSPQPPKTTTIPTLDNDIPQAICQSGNTTCTPGNYISPITDVCAKNYVLFLTSGGSSSDSSNDTEINNASLWKPDNSSTETLQVYKNNVACGASNDYCLDEISEFMYTHDFTDTITNGTANGDSVYQNVTTYGISINNSADDLDEAATVGGGYFRKAENPGSIAAVLEDIISDILGKNTSFVSPSISVNNYNRLQHLNDLYFSLFAPTENALWDGNLKKYKLIEGSIRDSDTSTNPNGKNAVNQTTGAFEVNALSFWTDPSDASLATVDTTDGVKNSVGADGDVTFLGGFQSRLRESDRKVYTNAVSGDLSHSDNRIHESNTTNITTAMLDIGTDTVLQERLLKWGRGIRFETSGTPPVETEFFAKKIGDLLHTSPVVVNYHKANATGPYDGDQTLYFGTNSGFIHGINNVAQNDLTSPIEAFAFAPKEMLPRFNDFYINQATTTKLYGMDGPITYWLDESNSTTPNFEVNSNEQAFLYATQRRGGRNIYALEVQDRDNPKLTWSIKGGPTANGGTPGFERLGQTWSRLKHATILDSNDNDIEVVIFAGGYDPSQDAVSSAPDSNGSEAATTMGNSIYIANAKTGALIWSGSPDASLAKNTQYLEMTHSIPSSVSVIDIDQDGYAEKMYAVDLAGQVWRFDIKADSTATAGFSVSGGVMAKLNQENASSTIDFKSSKRFYSGPSITYLSDANSNFLTIAVGSGYRAHPLDEKINDKFYVLKDYYPYGPPTDINGIVNYSTDMIYDDSDATTPVKLNNITPTTVNPAAGTHGWAFDFSDTGEKVINPAIAIDGKVFFTSYLPESNTPVSGTTNCAPNAFLGKSRLYSIYLKTGGPGFKAEVPDDSSPDDDDDTITTSVYYDEVTAPGASGGPRAIFTPSTGSDPDCASQSDLLVLVGTDVFDPGICTAPVRTYWQRVE